MNSGFKNGHFICIGLNCNEKNTFIQIKHLVETILRIIIVLFNLFSHSKMNYLMMNLINFFRRAFSICIFVFIILNFEFILGFAF